jgi:hypothetical protein
VVKICIYIIYLHIMYYGIQIATHRANVTRLSRGHRAKIAAIFSPLFFIQSLWSIFCRHSSYKVRILFFVVILRTNFAAIFLSSLFVRSLRLSFRRHSSYEVYGKFFKYNQIHTITINVVIKSWNFQHTFFPFFSPFSLSSFFSLLFLSLLPPSPHFLSNFFHFCLS